MCSRPLAVPLTIIGRAPGCTALSVGTAVSQSLLRLPTTAPVAAMKTST